VKFPETTVAGVPITVYAPTSAPARAYLQLGREVLARIDPGSVEVGAPGSQVASDPAGSSGQLALG
jgi:hypothetical protein